MCKAGFACLFTSRCVPLCGSQAQDARHLGRYGPGGQSSSMAVACARRGFVGYDALRAVFLSVRRPMILGIMAVWTGRTVAGIAGFHALRALFPGSQAPDVWHHGRFGPEGQLRHLFRGAEADTMVQTVRLTMDILSCSTR